MVRNGHMPERTVLTGAGGLAVRQPRVHDRRPGKRFTSSILLPYMRRSPSLDALIPAPSLKGISTGEFPEALEAILGPGAGALSANTVTRLKRELLEGELSDRSKIVLPLAAAVGGLIVPAAIYAFMNWNDDCAVAISMAGSSGARPMNSATFPTAVGRSAFISSNASSRTSGLSRCSHQDKR